MPASAILVVSDQLISPAVARFARGERDEIEITGLPICCLEIFGQSVLERTVARLQQAGIHAISEITGANVVSPRPDRNLEIILTGRSDDRWAIAERTVKEHAEREVEQILLLEMGPYLECDLAEALQFHRAKRNLLTQLRASQQGLDCWIVNAAVVRMSRNCILPFGADSQFGRSVPYLTRGYVNRLADAHDLRRLVVDAFLERCAIRPRGRQVRPGIWMEDDARVHRSARITAPAYLGRSVKVKTSAVVARFSNVERNCRIGAGTVVDSASILAYTALGRGLDVSHAVVDGNEFVDLTSDLTVRIDDPKLVRGTRLLRRAVPEHQPERVEATTPRDEGFQAEPLADFSRTGVRLSEVFRDGI